MATMPFAAEQSHTARVKRKGETRRLSKERKLSRSHAPEDLTLEQWQAELRREFGRRQAYHIKNVGSEPTFSEFHVTNPESKNTYRVAIRGTQPGDNFCSCPDFATNTLGTCKHVEFTLAWLESRRGGAKALRAGYQAPFSEVYLHYGARREVRFRPGRDCPVELARLAARHFDPDGTLRTESFAKFEKLLAESAAMGHDLRCYDDALAFVAEVRDAERRRDRIDRAFPRGIGSAAFKKLLKVPLYDYQREGALFAARAGRSLIGDEMGLGKTIQAIAAAEIMARELGVERVLVVCPTSLKHQWEREIARFCARSAQVIGGLRPRRQQAFASDSFYKITNYDTVRRDLDLIQAWSPDLVILDEAQRIKNWKTLAARFVKKISSSYAIVLTGTPLENRLEELVSIVQFVDQHRLGPTFRFLHHHQVPDEHGRVIGYRNLDKIGKSLEPILIRRKKDEVLDQLPGRLDKNFFVPMTAEQRNHHEENREIVARIVRKWRIYGFLTEADQRRLMIALQNMRMSCDSTFLLDQKTDFGVKADELATLLEEVFEQQDAKVVVFSQWLRMHEVLLRRFEARRWNHVLFHGGVPGAERKDLVDRFREDPDCRAFLATDAGGVGLNLQHANVVVNMDLPWNPAVLEQRIGRVHRLGQRQPVRVVNFIAQGTIEEGMLSVLAFKKSLFSGVLDGGDKEVFLGGTRLKRFMDSVEQTSQAIPAAQVVESATEDLATSACVLPQPEAEPMASGAPRMRAPISSSDLAAADPWAGLIEAGLALLQDLTGAATGSSARPSASDAERTDHGLSLVRRDDQTGESYIRIPVPPREILDRALRALSALLQDRSRQ